MKHARKKIVLHAGEYCFDKAGTHIHTLLGSCVSITMWHPALKIGGMCHFAISRENAQPEHRGLDPRYAEDCITLFKNSIKRLNTRLSEYEVKLFGGGNMYEKHPVPELPTTQKQPIGEKNVAAAYRLLLDEGANIQVAHVGEFGYRKVVFDITTGDVWVKFNPAKNAVGDTRSLTGRK